MSVPLLKTKLRRPHIPPDLVPRLDLVARLDGGLERKLTVVSAPAGYGKTTLVSAWAGQCRCRISWLSLDEGDSDPLRFLAYLITATQNIQPGLGREILDVLQSSAPSDPSILLPALINQLEDIPDCFAIVLDDYHRVSSPQVHKLLSFIVEHQPAQMHLIVATRVDPPLPIVQLRAQGQLVELRQAELRFTAEEASAFLKQRTGKELSVEEVEMLVSRTEGWAVGLQMAAVSLRGHADPARFIRSFGASNRYVLDYLADEILDRQGPEVQDFLLRTSVLETMSGPLCAALVAQTVNAQGMLQHLDEANLPVVPLDEDRRWYRYHRLFGDLLRRRLEEKHGAAVVQQLHRLACEWYERNSFVNEAVSHAIAAEEYEHAVELIGRTLRQMSSSRDMKTCLSWLRALPDARVRADPLLSIAFAWGLLANGEYDKVEPHLRDVEHAVGLERTEGDVGLQLPPSNHQAEAELLAIRANLALTRSDPQQCLDLSQQAIAALGREEETKLLHSRKSLLCILEFVAGVAHGAMGNVPAAEDAFNRSLDHGRAEPDAHLRGLCMTQMAQLQMVRGKLREAAHTFRQVLEPSHTDSFAASPFRSLALVGLGIIFYEWNDLEKAISHLMEGSRLGRLTADWAAILLGHLYAARIKSFQGDPDEAWQLSTELDEYYGKYPPNPLITSMTEIIKAWILLIQGDLPGAIERCQKADLEPGPDIPYGREAASAIYLKMMIAQGKTSEAQDRIASLLSRAEGKGETGHVIGLLVLQALAYHATGESSHAQQALERALDLGEPEGYVRTFLDEGELMKQMLSQAVKRQIHPEYAGHLIASYTPSHPGRSFEKERGLAEEMALCEPLSERELEVLRLISEGFSNKEVARELSVSVRTVKFHTGNLFGKLGVRSRTEAVAKARTLGVLPR